MDGVVGFTTRGRARLRVVPDSCELRPSTCLQVIDVRALRGAKLGHAPSPTWGSRNLGSPPSGGDWGLPAVVATGAESSQIPVNSGTACT